MKPTLIVLAAGLGTRYGGLKQMDPVGPSGETMIDYSIYDAARAGFEKVIFVIRPDFADDFKKTLGQCFKKVIQVDYAYQQITAVPNGFQVQAARQKPWGTGHAVLAAKELVREPFAVINADDYYGAQAFKTMAAHLGKMDLQSNHSCMIGYTLRQTLSEHGTVSRGVCESNEESLLLKINERTKIEKRGGGAVFEDQGEEIVLSGDEVVSMNFWGFAPNVFEYLENQFKDFLAKHGSEENSEFFIPTAVDTMIQAKQTRTKILHSGAPWFGITYPEDKPEVTQAIKNLIAKDIYSSHLWKA